MKPFWIRLASFATLSVLIGNGWAQEPETVAEYLRKQQENPLHERTKKAGGRLRETRSASPAKLFSDLKSLFSQSHDVLLVHIIRNGCQVSPSGQDPITSYNAAVLRSWKGSPVGDLVNFSVPVGMVAFDHDTRAVATVLGFRPLVNGGRYVVFLRFASNEERQLTPGLRLVGDGVQGAFALEDEFVFPAYQFDAFWEKYKGTPVPQFLSELQSLTEIQKQE